MLTVQSELTGHPSRSVRTGYVCSFCVREEALCLR
jgi:hypothetical protein